MKELADRRMLLVHAHPDDETINNGATMAGYVADGVTVTLVTCTRGEHGEVLVPALEHHLANRDNTLGDYRVGELKAAMEKLGVQDHLFLGDPDRRYCDSGMMGTPPNEDPRSFWKSDLMEAAARLVEIIRDRKPQVLITYDEFGGYGHPDHIKAHQIAMKAAELAADPGFGSGEPWEIQKIYWSAIPRSALQGSLTSSNPFIQVLIKLFNYAPSKWLAMPFVKADHLVTSKYEGDAFTDHKLAALRAHATQLILDGDNFTFSKRLGIKISGTEYYIRVKGDSAAPFDKDGRETDLFSAITK